MATEGGSRTSQDLAESKRSIAQVFANLLHIDKKLSLENNPMDEIKVILGHTANLCAAIDAPEEQQSEYPSQKPT